MIREQVTVFVSQSKAKTWLTIAAMDSFSFATSSVLEIPVNVKMSVRTYSLPRIDTDDPIMQRQP